MRPPAAAVVWTLVVAVTFCREVPYALAAAAKEDPQAVYHSQSKALRQHPQCFGSMAAGEVFRQRVTAVHAGWDTVVTLLGGRHRAASLVFLRWEPGTGNLTLVGSRDNATPNRLGQLYGFLKTVRTGTDRPDGRLGDGGDDASWARALCRGRSGSGKGGMSDRPAVPTKQAGRPPGEAAWAYAVVSTFDGANRYGKQAPAMYQHFMQPGCPNGHLIEFTAYTALAGTSLGVDTPGARCVHTFPTPYEMTGRTRASVGKAAAAAAVPLAQRTPHMMYRGSELALDRRPNATRERCNLYTNQRRDIFDLAERTAWLNATRRQHLEIEVMARYRHLLDVGGNGGTTWGALAWKLASGSLVFRVRSELHDWWEQTLVPWVHFIPVEYQVLHPEVLAQDLEAKHLWALARPAKSAQIARNGALAAQKAHKHGATIQCAKGVIDCLLPEGWGDGPTQCM